MAPGQGAVPCGLIPTLHRALDAGPVKTLGETGVLQMLHHLQEGDSYIRKLARFQGGKPGSKDASHESRVLCVHLHPSTPGDATEKC